MRQKNRDVINPKQIDVSTIMPMIDKMVVSITDPAAKDKARTDILNLILTQIQANSANTVITNEDNDQTQINVAESSNASIFVSGWRPFIGWICAIGLLYQFLLMPFISWILLVIGIHVAAMPGLDNTLWQLVFAMLGLGGLHTYEKVQGLPKEQYSLKDL